MRKYLFSQVIKYGTMKYNVILKNGAKDVLNFWVGEFSSAHDAVLTHLAFDRRNKATITDAETGDFRRYYWIGDKLNVSIL